MKWALGEDLLMNTLQPTGYELLMETLKMQR